jgi:hypothetical protein
MILKRWRTQTDGDNWFWLVAEFFILVVGFFVSLQVNDWQDSRSERQLEAEYLNRLLVDFEQSHSLLLESVNRVTVLLNKLDAGMDLLSEQVLSEAQHQVIFEAVSVAGFFAQLDILFGTLEELKDTGNMRLIRSKELRTGLANLWQRYQQAIRLSDVRALYRVDASSQLSVHLYPKKGTSVGWDTESVENSRRELYAALARIRHNQAADIADSKKLLSLLEENTAIIKSILK